MDNAKLLGFWIKVNELFEYYCAKMVLIWQKRKRILDTRLLIGSCGRTPKNVNSELGITDFPWIYGKIHCLAFY